MEIEYIPVADLKECPGNARIITEAAVDYVAESIRDAGFLNPVVIDGRNVIVCGHVSTRAAKKVGLEVVPCVRADDLTQEEIDAYRLADNRTASVAVWDREMLSAEFERLSGSYSPVDLGFDLSALREAPGTAGAQSREVKNTSKELDLGAFADEAFKHQCPHCGLRF